MNRLSFSLLLSGLASLLLLVSTGASAQTGESSQFIYVCNQGSASVTVIDASTQTITETVDLQELGFSENAKPHHVVAEPDGSYWYVTLIGENSVLKFNRNNELVDQAELEVPGLLALHPQDDLLFVGRSMSAVNPPQSYHLSKLRDPLRLHECLLPHECSKRYFPCIWRLFFSEPYVG